MTLPVTQSQIDRLLAHVRQIYPEWQNFDHPPFVQEEIRYKRQAVDLMHSLLAPNEFEALLQSEQYDEIVSRLERVARATNLLYLSTPQTGDLRILYAPTLDRGQLCRALFALLYGAEPLAGRLQCYLDFVNQHDSKLNYWTFPTYFLFLVHPASELFVRVTNVLAPTSST